MKQQRFGIVACMIVLLCTLSFVVADEATDTIKEDLLTDLTENTGSGSGFSDQTLTALGNLDASARSTMIQELVTDERFLNVDAEVFSARIAQIEDASLKSDFLNGIAQSFDGGSTDQRAQYDQIMSEFVTAESGSSQDIAFLFSYEGLVGATDSDYSYAAVDSVSYVEGGEGSPNGLEFVMDGQTRFVPLEGLPEQTQGIGLVSDGTTPGVAYLFPENEVTSDGLVPHFEKSLTVYSEAYPQAYTAEELGGLEGIMRMHLEGFKPDGTNSFEDGRGLTASYVWNSEYASGSDIQGGHITVGRDGTITAKGQTSAIMTDASGAQVKVSGGLGATSTADVRFTPDGLVQFGEVVGAPARLSYIPEGAAEPFTLNYRPTSDVTVNPTFAFGAAADGFSTDPFSADASGKLGVTFDPNTGFSVRGDANAIQGRLTLRVPEHQPSNAQLRVAPETSAVPRTQDAQIALQGEPEVMWDARHDVERPEIRNGNVHISTTAAQAEPTQAFAPPETTQTTEPAPLDVEDTTPVTFTPQRTRTNSQFIASRQVQTSGYQAEYRRVSARYGANHNRWRRG